VRNEGSIELWTNFSLSPQTNYF